MVKASKFLLNRDRNASAKIENDRKGPLFRAALHNG